MEQQELERLDQYQSHYSEEGLMDKLKRFGTKAGAKVVYDALLLYYVLRSDTVPSREKGFILGALGYLILPIDLIPDMIPVLGFSDDLAALVYVIGQVSRFITPAVKEQAYAKLHDWFPSLSQSDTAKFSE